MRNFIALASIVLLSAILATPVNAQGKESPVDTKPWAPPTPPDDRDAPATKGDIYDLAIILRRIEDKQTTYQKKNDDRFSRLEKGQDDIREDNRKTHKRLDCLEEGQAKTHRVAELALNETRETRGLVTRLNERVDSLETRLTEAMSKKPASTTNVNHYYYGSNCPSTCSNQCCSSRCVSVPCNSCSCNYYQGYYYSCGYYWYMRYSPCRSYYNFYAFC